MIVLFLLLLVIAGAVFWWRGRQRIEQQHGASQPASAERSVFNLEIGDIVQNDLRDWIVETIYQYNQDGFCQFHDYKGPDQRCLSVEIYGTEFDQGDLELCVGERIQAQQLSLLPGDGRSVYGSSTRVESQ